MFLSIVTPTYYEALNEKKFIKAIENLKDISDYEIIFVDDNSNDKTYDLFKNIGSRIYLANFFGVSDIWYNKRQQDLYGIF